MCWEDAPTDCQGDDCFGKQFCMPMTEGCPIKCMEGEHTCKESGDGYAYSWCQTWPCPPQCDWDTEQSCYAAPPPDCQGDDCYGTETCHPKSEACPVHCGPEEHACTQQPMYEGGLPYSWCQQKDFQCPPNCGDTEFICSIAPPDSCWQTADYDPVQCAWVDECHPKATGCPIKCYSAEEITCTQTDGEYGYQYCHWGKKCPPSCKSDEMQCWSPGPPGTEGEDVYSCVKTFKPDGSYNMCPVTCYAPDFKCESEWGDYCTRQEWGGCW